MQNKAEASFGVSDPKGMKVYKNRCIILIIGLLVGVCIGRELTHFVTDSEDLELDQILGNRNVDSRIWTILMSISTIRETEDEKYERIFSRYQMMLRNAFLGLVDLHKTGLYKQKDDDICIYLKQAKDFMADRPEQFLEQKFSVLPSLNGQTNYRDFDDNLDNAKVTNRARNELQDAFKYVDALSIPTNKN